MVRRSFPGLLWTTSGVLMIVAGLLSFLRPDAILSAAAVLFGIVLLFSAFSDFAVYFGTRGIRDGAWWMLFDGAATLLLALLLLFGSSRIVRSLPLLLGAWLLISGLSRTANALRLRSFGSDDWSWVLGCGALIGFCGLLFLFAPLAGLTAIGAVLGFALFLVGTVSLLGAYLANRFW